MSSSRFSAKLALLVLLGPPAIAERVPVERWTDITPPGGPIDLLAASSPSDGSAPVLYLAANKEVYRSLGDDSWERGGDCPVSPIQFLAVDPQASDLLYAAGGQEVVRSVDGGNTWSALQLPVSGLSLIQSIVADPQSSGRVLAANTEGLWASLDGEPFERMLEGGVFDLVFDPLDPHRLWAAGTDRQLRRSDDGGTTWTLLPGPIPGSLRVRLAAGPGALYLLQGSDTLRRSEDGGSTWTDHDPPLFGWPEVSPHDALDLIIANSLGSAWHSDDGGESWDSIEGDLLPAIHNRALYDPVDAQTVWLATTAGLRISRNVRTVLGAQLLTRSAGTESSTWPSIQTRKSASTPSPIATASTPRPIRRPIGVSSTPTPCGRDLAVQPFSARWPRAPMGSCTWQVLSASSSVPRTGGGPGPESFSCRSSHLCLCDWR